MFPGQATCIFWRYFPIPNPIQMDADGCVAIKSGNSSIRITTTSVSAVRMDTWLYPLLSAYRTCTVFSSGFIMATSLHIWRTLTWNNIFFWGNVYFLVFRKLEICNSVCQQSKLFFLVGVALKIGFPVWRNLGFTCHLSSLIFTSLLPGWILNTVLLVRIPYNGNQFTCLEIFHNERMEMCSA